MSTVRQQIEGYRVDVREKATRIVDDVQRGRRTSVSKREEAILRMCSVLARQEAAQEWKAWVDEQGVRHEW